MSRRYKLGRGRLEQSFQDEPQNANKLKKSYAYLTDCIVQAVWSFSTVIGHPNIDPTESENLAVIAVGGYGRAEMAPFSDVDLLFLSPYKLTPWAENVIETMLYLLWDLKLKVGHASRTAKECIRLGQEDFTIRTAMLELRHICGDQDLTNALEASLWSDLFKGSEREFISAKLEERDSRHEKQGGQRYMVEPNVKEGKGGLRDIHSLFWIAKYVYQVKESDDLVRLGFLTREEHRIFSTAEKFLWAVRAHLHLETGRASDQLSFDLQVEVAARLGYQGSNGRRAVEIFMQDYFRHATSIGDFTRIFSHLFRSLPRKGRATFTKDF